MSSDVREILTWIVLLILTPGVAWFLRADRDSAAVYRFTSGPRHQIQRYLSLGKKFLLVMMICLWLCIQDFIPGLDSLRPLFFVVACLFATASAYCISMGYALWRDGIEGKGSR